MSLSTCEHCGGHIPLGPDASNRCESCGRPIFMFEPHPGGLIQTDYAGYAALVNERDRIKDRIADLEAEVDRLKECARHQAKGPGGAKTLRVEIIAPAKGEDLRIIATFPSAMEDGDRKAAETIANTLGLLITCAEETPRKS